MVLSHFFRMLSIKENRAAEKRGRMQIFGKSGSGILQFCKKKTEKIRILLKGSVLQSEEHNCMAACGNEEHVWRKTEYCFWRMISV